MISQNISHYKWDRNCCFIKFPNSSSDMVLFACIMAAASLPAVYLSCGFSDVTACSMVFATSSGGEDDDALSIIDLKWFSTFFVSGKYGDFGSKAFFAKT